MDLNGLKEALQLFIFLIGLSPLIFIAAYAIGVLVIYGGKHE